MCPGAARRAITLLVLSLAAIETARIIPFIAAQFQHWDAELLAQSSQSRVRAVQSLGGGTYMGILMDRVVSYRATFILLSSRTPSVLAMFLLGMWVGRKCLPQHAGDHLP